MLNLLQKPAQFFLKLWAWRAAVGFPIPNRPSTDPELFRTLCSVFPQQYSQFMESLNSVGSVFG